MVCIHRKTCESNYRISIFIFGNIPIPRFTGFFIPLINNVHIIQRQRQIFYLFRFCTVSLIECTVFITYIIYTVQRFITRMSVRKCKMYLVIPFRINFCIRPRFRTCFKINLSRTPSISSIIGIRKGRFIVHSSPKQILSVCFGRKRYHVCITMIATFFFIIQIQFFHLTERGYTLRFI